MDGEIPWAVAAEIGGSTRRGTTARQLQRRMKDEERRRKRTNARIAKLRAATRMIGMMGRLKAPGSGALSQMADEAVSMASTVDTAAESLVADEARWRQWREEKEAAAIRLQAAYRGQQIRRRQGQIRRRVEAAMRVQRMHRGRMVRVPLNKEQRIKEAERLVKRGEVEQRRRRRQAAQIIQLHYRAWQKERAVKRAARQRAAAEDQLYDDEGRRLPPGWVGVAIVDAVKVLTPPHFSPCLLCTHQSGWVYVCAAQ